MAICFHSIAEGSCKKGRLLEQMIKAKYPDGLARCLSSLEGTTDVKQAYLTNSMFACATATAKASISGAVMMRKYRYVLIV